MSEELYGGLSVLFIIALIVFSPGLVCALERDVVGRDTTIEHARDRARETA